MFWGGAADFKEGGLERPHQGVFKQRLNRGKKASHLDSWEKNISSERIASTKPWGRRLLGVSISTRISKRNCVAGIG